MASLNENRTRVPSTVAQRAGGQTAVGALNLFAGNALLGLGMPTEALSIFTIIFQGAFTLFGKILRNIAKDKGWLKYVG